MFLLVQILCISPLSAIFQIDSSWCSPFWELNEICFLLKSSSVHSYKKRTIILNCRFIYSQEKLKWLTRGTVTGANDIPCQESSRETVTIRGKWAFHNFHFYFKCLLTILTILNKIYFSFSLVFNGFLDDQINDRGNLYCCLYSIRHRLWLLGCWIHCLNLL